MRQLLALGHTLLCTFVAQQGVGDSRPEVSTPEVHTARRLPECHDRRYVSIFGELTITPAFYGTRERQRIERVPLDERLGLPESDFSYVLEDWSQRLGLKESLFEVPYRGYLPNVTVHLEDGTRHRLTFLDLSRLEQSLADNVRMERADYTEPGLVLLPDVSTAAIHRAVQGLWDEGYFHRSPSR